jgi:integrase
MEESMGSIYRPKYKDRHGVERESAIWWIQYYSHGRKIREATDTTDFTEAKDKLKEAEGKTTRGRITRSMERKVLYSELADLVEKDYELNGYRSAVDIELRHRLHILPYFGKIKASRIAEADIDDYILHRRDEGASNATINRELVTIKRAYSLGIQKRIVSDRPHITLLEEDNVRQGFFEREQLESVLKHLWSWNRPPARFAYITGWRKQEVLTLKWPQGDFEAGYVRLEPGTTKNREARVFPFTDELREIMEEQREKADVLKKAGIITPWVFFREGKTKRGRQIGDFKKNWNTACTDAGVPGRIFHDLRRTAVRNLVRAGIPERVAMKMTGHKTRSIFERYNIVSDADMKAAAEKLNDFSKTDKDTDKDRPKNEKARNLRAAK